MEVSWRVVLGTLVLGWGLMIISCAQGGGEANFTNPKGEKTGLWALASNLGTNVIDPSLTQLRGDMKALSEMIYLQCQKGFPFDVEKFDREKLKPLFLQAMRSYHFTEAFQIGLRARNGGELQEKIYYPGGANVYLIDTGVAKLQNFSDHSEGEHPRAIGFSALEYLIYEDSLSNSCQNCGDPILQKWNELSLQERLGSRCQYMVWTSDLLTRQIESLQQSWFSVRGDMTLSQIYREDFKTLKEFTLRLLKGLHFFEKRVKDHRLGVPSGMNNNICGLDSCPESSEHPFSEDSIYSLLYSARGLLSVFTGTIVTDSIVTIDLSDKGLLKGKEEAYGFDDWLLENGHGDLALRFKRSINYFIENLEGLNKNTHIALLAQGVKYKECRATTSTNRVVEICALYQDLKNIMDLYNTEILLAADFGRPVDQGGDTD